MLDGSEREHVPDLRRAQRIGFDEAIYCQSKSAADVAAIIEEARTRGDSLLLTRLDAAKHADLPDRARTDLDYDPISRTAFLGNVEAPSGKPRVCIVTAGTSDGDVAREAARTLTYYGEPCRLIGDVGVAGLWRLLERLPDIETAPVIIAVAGMEAALPSVLGGLVPGLVIAVPTSTGYGIGAGGTTALHAALSSCAPGIVVVNIDNGYGAACAALRGLRGPGAGNATP